MRLQQKESLEAEKKRLDEERQKREVLRRKQELQEIEKKQAMDKIAALKKTSVGAKALKDLTEEVISGFIFSLIISITKFLIVIGHPCAHFLPNWRSVIWVSNCNCPVATLCCWIPVIGHLHRAHVNQMCLNVVFFFAVSLLVSN